MAEKVPGFLRLSADVSLLEPDPQSLSPSNEADSPSTIIVFAWMGAQSRYVSKYTSHYFQRYPNAQILLITSNWGNFTYRPMRTQHQRLAPAIPALLAKDDGKTLVHAFSNGGSIQFNSLAAAYRKETGKLLPVRALVLDSAPGRATLRQSVGTILATLQMQWYLRPLLVVLASLFVGTLWLVKQLTGAKDVVEQLREDLNDRRLVAHEARRCYIYSDTDESVSAKDVEEHADDARQKGWLVSMEKFVGSAHAGHMRLDGARYWKIVEGLWEQSCNDI